MPSYRIERTLGGIVAGVDEAGRGPLAGPVAAAAVILMPALLPRRLLRAIDDSKVVPAETRAVIAAELLARAQRADGGVVAAVACASAREIDRINILQASLLAMTRAIARLAVTPTAVLIDGNILPKSLPCPGRAVVDGDALCLSIAAASILAKVARDRLMARLAERYPAYGWERNAGYGTPEHHAGITAAGPNRHHRRSFAPFRLLENKINIDQ